ncbi:MAG TPA: type IV pilin [Candidatus Poseidoniales archaeon]|mgnify:CR=1 FL=1|nr:MAG TPA: type IV pilin [Candidatus Poseidoniales archaeon]
MMADRLISMSVMGKMPLPSVGAEDKNMNMNKNNKNDEAVSPVIATILMVAITVVLAGVLYVWANSLASDQPDAASLNNFDASDASAAMTAGDDDTMLRMSWTYADEDLNWAFVSFKLEIGDNVYDCEVEANAADGDECMIKQNGGDSDTQWESDEIVFIHEYNTDICSSQCTVEITVQYNGQVLSGTPSVPVA